MNVAERQARAEGLRVDSQDFHRVLLAAKEFDKRFYANLRAALRDAAEPMVADMKANIRAIPSQGKYRWGMREAMVKGTRASIVTGGKTGARAGIRIQSKPKPVTYTTRGGAKVHDFPIAAFNARRGVFRHPVFGNREKWSEQQGRPWFGAVVYQHQEDVRRRIAEALSDAAKAMEQDVEHG